METAESVTEKPGAFEASGESPPSPPAIPPHLAEELAEIIADALVADYCGEGLNKGGRQSSAASGN